MFVLQGVDVLLSYKIKCFDELHEKHLSTRHFYQNVFINKKLHAILLIFKALVYIIVRVYS